MVPWSDGSLCPSPSSATLPYLRRHGLKSCDAFLFACPASSLGMVNVRRQNAPVVRSKNGLRTTVSLFTWASGSNSSDALFLSGSGFGRSRLGVACNYVSREAFEPMRKLRRGGNVGMAYRADHREHDQRHSAWRSRCPGCPHRGRFWLRQDTASG